MDMNASQTNNHEETQSSADMNHASSEAATSESLSEVHPSPSTATVQPQQQQQQHVRHTSFDMESLLLQWGGSANLESNDIIDESPLVASSSAASSLPPAADEAAAMMMMPPPFVGRSHSTTPHSGHRSVINSSTNSTAGNTNAEAAAAAAAASSSNNHHRRIASTGGDRLLYPSSILLSPQTRHLAPSVREHVNPDDGSNNNNSSDTTNNNAPSVFTGEELHAAARITDWNLVSNLSTSSNSQLLAKYRGPDGWTALHHACSRRCPHPAVIESLLRAYPPAVTSVDDRGWTPLHHACRFKAPKEVVRLLLRSHPDLGSRSASIRCNQGRSSLYYAMRYEAPSGVVELLLHADPTAVLDEDRDGMCPLSLVWDGYANGFGGKRDLKALLRKFEGEFEYNSSGVVVSSGGDYSTENTDGNNSTINNNNDNTTNEQYENSMIPSRDEELITATKRVREAMQKDTPALRQLQSKWRIVNNLLRAYFHFPIQTLDSEYSVVVDEDDEKSNDNEKNNNNNNKKQQQRKWRILHAVSAIKCHHTLFLLARALHPEQALELDCNDLLGVDCYHQYHGNDDNNNKGGNSTSSGHDHHCNNHTNKPQSISVESHPISKRTALHFAAMSPLSGKDGRNVIRTLLTLNPNSSKHVDGYGSLPLHLMAENEHKVHWVQDGFRDVHNAHVEASSCRDGLGRTPLHCATSCSGRYSMGTTVVPQPAGPDGENTATTIQNNNAAPQPDINNAARNIGSVILNLVIVNRNAASIADNTGRLPLHYIAEHGEEWSNDAASILAAHPAASRTRAGAVAYNQLPLHMAASNPDACPSLLRNLVEANPRAASMVEGTGRLPLHMACDSGRTSWDRGIESIYEAYHAAISTREESPRGWTVLHTVAASPSAGRDLIENILNLNPDAASIADGEGRHPLHLACMAGRHWEEGGVRLLFEADPNATLTADRFGFLPFHMVAMRKACLVDNSNVNDRLESGIERNEENGADGNKERIESNEEEDLASMDVLFNLLIAQPDTIQSK